MEKLGILFLLNYFNQLGSVKNHLFLAAKEVLEAARASTDMVTTQATKTVVGSKLEFIAPVLAQVQALLAYGIQKMETAGGAAAGGPEGGPSARELPLASAYRLKNQVLESIIGAIDDEIEQTEDTLNEKNRLKIEALNSVRRVLQSQKTVPLEKRPVNVA
ncbi:MAG: hypothetical protein Q7T11_04475 [Deltaproteobacteria bacterium]|nr:hypothetical protein [Deltaproteobacteria bacterium]